MQNAHHDQDVGAIYPAYCFGASPTYNKWVKLTAADVQGLRTQSGFEGTKLKDEEAEMVKE